MPGAIASLAGRTGSFGCARELRFADYIAKGPLEQLGCVIVA